ncbi:MAG: UDP-3-O-(3-hydroxymyristoyl)glucosamine N-acyltransferase, partial [Bryobacteraceae bacterium]|nr:UDP-3-O-(3-hydroxymyristoyl)glucosamine N-acyltransferase [Bryobacteraceae bacterium]
MTVSELAGRLGLRFEGNAKAEISGAAPVESASAIDIAFAGPKAFAAAQTSSAGCIVATTDYQPPEHQTVIRADNPRRAFAAALQLLFPPEPLCPGIHATALIAPSATIDESCDIGPFVTIGPGAVIDPTCRIEAGCRIGSGVRIGAGSHLHPNVTLYAGTVLGKSVVLHTGVVIGADGFGFVPTGGRWEKFPQVGHVEIGDHVEIGANSCVDRA